MAGFGASRASARLAGVTRTELRELYGARLARAKSDAELWEKRSHQVSNLRGLAFLVLAGAGIALAAGEEKALMGALTCAAFVAFVLFVAWHGRVLAREDTANRAAAVNG